MDEMINFKKTLTPALLQRVYNEGREVSLPVDIFEQADPCIILTNYFNEQLRHDLLDQIDFTASNYTTKQDMLGILMNEAYIKKEARDWEKENINRFYKHMPQWSPDG